MLFEPLAGWRHVEVTARRTKVDSAQVLRSLSDRCYPTASEIVLVMDNLNTHKLASLYEAFPAVEARRIAERSRSTPRPRTAVGWTWRRRS